MVIKVVTSSKGNSWFVQKMEKRKINGRLRVVPVESIGVQKTSSGNYVSDSLVNMKIFPTRAKAIASAKRAISKRK